MQGNLSDMAIADLIQHSCQDRKTARLSVASNGKQAVIFFKNGEVVHAAYNGQEGEEAVFQILTWDEGTFDLELGAESPSNSIARPWSRLLLEGARRLDENLTEPDQNKSTQFPRTEVNKMAQKLKDILNELSGEVNGYLASAVVGMDGLSIADHTKSAKLNPEVVNAQMALFFKLVDTSTAKMNAGAVEDNLLTTDSTYILIRFLPGKNYFLEIAIDHKSGNLGNLRLMSKVYSERISKAIPR